MRKTRLCKMFGLAMAFVVLVFWTTTAVAQLKEEIDYWRTRYEALLPSDDPRVARAQAVFDRLIKAAGKRPGIVPRLFIVKRDPWGISLPIALPDGWIILSKSVLDICYRNSARGDDRLAFVLGHEIAHQIKDDFWHLKFFQALEAAKTRHPQPNKPLNEIEGFFQSPAEERPAQELRADERGIIYAAMAGFNTRAIVTEGSTDNFFQDWIRARAPHRLGLKLAAASHPTPQQRTAALQMHLQQVVDKTALFESGLWFYYAGDYPKAIRAFEQFLTFFPSREVYHNLAVAHHQLALATYQWWKGDVPPLPFHLSLAIDPLTRASRIYLRKYAWAQRGPTEPTRPVELFRQHLDKAIGFYREAIIHDASYTPAATNLGCALLVRGIHSNGGIRHADVYEAVAMLQRALERAPHSPEILNNLGVALFYVKRASHARANLTRARSLRPAYPAPVFNLGYMAQVERRQADAQRYWRDYEQLVAQPTPEARAGGQENEHVTGLSIGYLDDQIPKRWGTPVQSTFRVAKRPFTMSMYPSGIMTLAQDGELLLILVREGFADTSTRGITIGSMAQEVLSRYGSPTRRLATTQGQIWGYDTQRIAFQLRSGRVVSWLLF